MPHRSHTPAVLAALAALALTAPATAAHAQVSYTFDGAFDFGTPTTVSFVVQTPSYIGAPGDFAPVTCSTSNPAQPCAATMRFEPDGFSTGRTFIGVNLVGGTAFYFFDAGALLTDGTYAAIRAGLPGIDPGTGDPALYGSAGDATLTVAANVAAVPEPATVMLLGAGLAALGVAARRRRTAAVA